MRISGTRILFCFVSTVAFTVQLHPQDSARIVILSPRVGLEINREEHDRFLAFSQIDNFLDGVVFWRPDSSFFARIHVKQDDNAVKDTIVELTEGQVFRMAETIDHFEDLVQANYRMGSSPVLLRTFDGQLIQRRVFRPPAGLPQSSMSLYTGRLPLSPGSVDRDLTIEPGSTALGLGIATYSPDYNGLISAYREAEQSYSSAGYVVPPHEPRFSTSTILWLNIRMKITQTWSLLLDAGTQIGGDANVKCADALLQYAFREYNLAGFHPYAAAGACMYTLSVDQPYGSSSAQYYTLDALTFKASEYGVAAQVGVETGSRAPLNLHVGYVYCPDASKTTNQGADMRLKMASLVFGGRVSVFF